MGCGMEVLSIARLPWVFVFIIQNLLKEIIR